MKTNKIIGEKIKNLREMKNLTVEDIAERTGMSTAQIDRIERNDELPSLAPLIRIARVMGVRLGTFLDDQQELGPVVFRKKNLKQSDGISFSGASGAEHGNMLYYSLSQDKSGRHMEPFLVDIRPAAKDSFVFSTHEGEEFIFVLEGMIEISYGKNTYVLEAGDCIYYDSIVAHHVHAGNDEPARILGVIYTPY
ncbi:MAG: XRE family transcriptional regulator [Tannerella sp.]|jgi:mannose-6-phosphate isomerase-like protein (cupin superfamily)|nr:XRE family transcriptional regulator [Tannerella sp.]